LRLREGDSSFVMRLPDFFDELGFGFGQWLCTITVGLQKTDIEEVLARRVKSVVFWSLGYGRGTRSVAWLLLHCLIFNAEPDLAPDGLPLSLPLGDI
jgi:hypothetical protein